MPDTPETILAFDFGKRRIGVATGQDITQSANPLTVVANGERGPDWQQIETLIDDWRPQRLVVGLPLHADGSASEVTQSVRMFMTELERYGLPVSSIDERFSSVEAEGLLKSQRSAGFSGRITKEMVDSVAATLIAERWLKKEF